MAGRSAMGTAGAYSATKFGVVGFSEALAKELASEGVKVCALCPSATDTDMIRSLDLVADELKIKIDDLVNAVDFLLKLSPAALVPCVEVQCASFLR